MVSRCSLAWLERSEQPRIAVHDRQKVLRVCYAAAGIEDPTLDAEVAQGPLRLLERLALPEQDARRMLFEKRPEAAPTGGVQRLIGLEVERTGVQTVAAFQILVDGLREQDGDFAETLGRG